MAAILAGIALVGFGGASWLLIYKVRLTRLDSDLKNQLRREAAPLRFDRLQAPRRDQQRDQDYWQSSEAVIGAVFGSQEDVALLVIDPQEQTVYRSPNWLLAETNLFPPPSRFFRKPPRQDRGNALDQLRAMPPPHPPNNPEDPPDQGGNMRIETRSSSQGDWRVGAVAHPAGKVAIAVNLRVLDREMSTISGVFGFAITLTLLLVAIAAWVLSERALKPLYKVTATLRGVTATDLSQRVSEGAADVEFGELLQVFNQMMERLERSFKQASRFSADAAHELKTPLAILQGELERTLHHAKPGSPLQQQLSGLLDEVGRLKGIIRKLLLLSLADAGQMRFTLVETDLSILLGELVDDIEMLAPDLEVQVQIAPKLWANIDRDLVIQVLYNLITNAIKYNQPDGWLKIHARYQGDTVAVTIQNKSLDMSALDRQQVFDRFYRGGSDRQHKIEGVGLGLALSREIARGHGGELKLDQTPTGSTAFTLTLPKPAGIKAK